MFHDIVKSYKWNIETAESLSRQKQLNGCEVYCIISRLGKAELCSTMISVDYNDSSFKADFSERQKVVVANLNRNANQHITFGI